MHYRPQHPPSRSKRYLICDICGCKFHQQDTVQITDPYSRQYGFIVCKRDYDQSNVQDRPFLLKGDTILAQPTYVRPRTSEVYIPNPNDDRLPGKPTNGRAIPNPLEDLIDLYWDAPGDHGSSGIVEYRIERAQPQLFSYEVITTGSSSSSTYYSDITANVNLEYSYKIAAINTFGMGPYSDEFFWPVRINPDIEIDYLVSSQDGASITTGSGLSIRVNYPELGVI